MDQPAHHIAVLNINIGGYHAARLRAAHQQCVAAGWQFTAIQASDHTFEHPWGNLEKEISFPLLTLVSMADMRRAEGSPFQESEILKQAANKVEQVLDALQPDVVFILGWGFALSQKALRWCRKNDAIPVVMSESKLDDKQRNWLKERYKAIRYVRHFSAALVGGKKHRDYLIKLGIPSARIFIGYDAVDNLHFQQGADNARKNPDNARMRQPSIPMRPYFLAASRFIARKNLVRLVEAYVQYRKTISSQDTKDLVLIGSGEEGDAIAQVLHKYNINQFVHMPGFIGYQDLPDWYGLADAFVHPALHEQWGLVINEACASGLPILCSNTVGAAYELIHNGISGWLFDPTNLGEITHALLRIHHLSNDGRMQMGLEGRKLVSDFGPERFADGFYKAILTTLAHQQGGCPH